MNFKNKNFGDNLEILKDMRKKRVEIIDDNKNDRK